MADEKSTTIAPPPDGGFGWVIVVCIFVITFLTFGTMYCIGVIFDVLMVEFNCTKAEVSVVASIAFSLQCFLGPFVSLLLQRYSARRLVAIGVLIVAVAFISSAFATSLYVLYFTFGVIGGAGTALIYLPLTVMVSFYFEKRRSIAVALGGIGGSIGCFLHPYLIRFLMHIYDWRGALILLGALELNSLGAAFLLRPIETCASKKRHVSVPKTESVVVQSDSDQALTSFIEKNIAGCQAQGDDNSDTTTLPPFKRDNISLDLIEEEGPDGTVRPPDHTARSISQMTPTSPDGNRRESYTSGLVMKGSRRLFSRSRSNKANRANEMPSSSGLEPVDEILTRAPSKISRLSSFGNLYSSDIASFFYDAQSQIGDFAAQDEDEDFVAAVDFEPPPTPPGTMVTLRQLSRMQSRMSSCRQDKEPVEEDVVDAAASYSKSKKIGEAFVRYFDHFKNPRFIGFLIFNFMKGFIYYTPSLFIVGWARHLEIAEDKTTMLLSLVGIGNIVGRPLLALVSDRLRTYRIHLLTITVLLNGALTLTAPLFPDFYYLAMFVFMYSFLLGGGQTMLTPILADLVSLKELAYAFGILIAAEGAAILIGPPLLGLFTSYALTFTAAGSIMLLSTVALIFVAFYQRIFATKEAAHKKSDQNN